MEPRELPRAPLAEVQCIAGNGSWTLVFVRELHHPPEKVWIALTDPDGLREWSPYTADRDLGRTGAFTLTMVDGDAREDYSETVTRAESPSVLEHTWGGGSLRWRLEATDAGTRLTLSHTVEAPDVIPKVAAGWHLCLVVADQWLGGAPIGPIVGQDAMRYGWQELHDAYAAKLGITVER